jgi:hypothetical protein
VNSIAWPRSHREAAPEGSAGPNRDKLRYADFRTISASRPSRTHR